MKVNVKEVKVGDIILDNYKLQVSDGSGVGGAQWKTYETELEVMRVKVLDSGKIRFTVASPAHIMTKTYSPRSKVEIKGE